MFAGIDVDVAHDTAMAIEKVQREVHNVDSEYLDVIIELAKDASLVEDVRELLFDVGESALEIASYLLRKVFEIEAAANGGREDVTDKVALAAEKVKAMVLEQQRLEDTKELMRAALEEAGLGATLGAVLGAGAAAGGATVNGGAMAGGANAGSVTAGGGSGGGSGGGGGIGGGGGSGGGGSPSSGGLAPPPPDAEPVLSSSSFMVGRKLTPASDPTDAFPRLKELLESGEIDKDDSVLAYLLDHPDFGTEWFSSGFLIALRDGDDEMMAILAAAMWDRLERIAGTEGQGEEAALKFWDDFIDQIDRTVPQPSLLNEREIWDALVEAGGKPNIPGLLGRKLRTGPILQTAQTTSAFSPPSAG